MTDRFGPRPDWYSPDGPHLRDRPLPYDDANSGGDVLATPITHFMIQGLLRAAVIVDAPVLSHPRKHESRLDRLNKVGSIG